MIYVENTSNYPQTVHIPRDEGENMDIRGYQFQKKDYNIDENGEYYIYPDDGYDAITAGTITVNVPTDTQEAYDKGYSDGYSSGVTEGEEAQKAKLEPLTATTNGHYANQDGYSDVYVDVEGGGDYSSGYTDGMAAQKALLTSTTITTNGQFTRENGWDEVNVNVPQSDTAYTLTAITATANGEYYPSQYNADCFNQVTVDVKNEAIYDQGFEDGEEAQKLKLESLTATTNGHYTSEDGWNDVTVNVPQSGTGATLTAITATANGEYYPVQYGVDGFSQVTVDLSNETLYNQGYEDGQAAQKSLLGAFTANTNGYFTSQNGYSAITVNVPTTGSTYPKSFLTVDIYSDDYSGLSDLVVNFKANDTAYSSFTPTSAVTSTTVTYDPGIWSTVSFMVPDGYQCSYGKFVEWNDVTRWDNHTYLYYGLTRYSGSVTEVRVYTYNGSGSTFGVYDFQGVTYDGSTTANTEPTKTFNVSEQRWDLEYDGALVRGFRPLSSDIKYDVRRIELPYEFSRIYGLGSTPNLETIYAEGLTHIGPEDSSQSTGLGYCTGLTAITSVVGLRRIEHFGCQNCPNLSEIDLSRVSFIGSSGFLGCTSLTSVDLTAIEIIDFQAFWGCSSLTSVTIGRNCTEIRRYGFGSCSSLSEIWCWATTAPTVGWDTFDVAQNGTLYVPNGSDYSSWMAYLPSGWTISYIN